MPAKHYFSCQSVFLSLMKAHAFLVVFFFLLCTFFFLGLSPKWYERKPKQENISFSPFLPLRKLFLSCRFIPFFLFNTTLLCLWYITIDKTVFKKVKKWVTNLKRGGNKNCLRWVNFQVYIFLKTTVVFNEIGIKKWKK